MRLLQVLQLAHHAVKLKVRYLRCIQHVVVMIVAVQFCPQGLYLLLDGGHDLDFYSQKYAFHFNIATNPMLFSYFCNRIKEDDKLCA